MSTYRASRLFIIKFLGLWGSGDKVNDLIQDKNLRDNQSERKYIEQSRVSSNDVAQSLEPDSLSSDKYKPAIEAANKRIVALLLEKGIPGMTIAVSRKGETVWKAAYGFCDVENQLPCLPDANMRIASISKMLFATSVVGPLLESKKINPKDSIYQFLSVAEYPKQKYNGQEVDITLEQLLSHTSGVRSYDQGDEILVPIGSAKSKKLYQSKEQISREHFFSRETFRNVFDALKPIRDNAVIFKPGEFNYTTYGYTLLSAAIQKVIQPDTPKEPEVRDKSIISKDDEDGKKDNKKPVQIEDFWMEKLRTDWRMKETFLDQDEVIIPNRSRYYMRSGHNGSLANAPYVDNSIKWAGGGLSSTTRDLLMFGNKLIDCYKAREGAPLKRDTINQLWAVVGKEYALGAQVSLPEKGERSDNKFVIYHMGAAVGCSSVLTIVPDEETVVAILVNLNDVSLYQLSLFIAKTFHEVESK